MANFSDECSFESGFSFICSLKENECYTNINFHEILLKTLCAVKFSKFENFERVLQVFRFLKNRKFDEVFKSCSCSKPVWSNKESN